MQSPQFNDALSEVERAEAAVFEKLRVDDFAGAVPLAKEAMRLTENLFGPDAVETGASYQNVGFLLQRTGQPAEAAPFFEKALAIYQRTQPPTYDDTHKVIAALTEIYLKAGRADDVLRINKDQLAAGDQPAGDDNAKMLTLAQMHSLLGTSRRAEHKFDEAAKEWEQSIGLYKGRASPEEDNYRVAIEGLLAYYSAKGNGEASRKLIADVMQDLKAHGQEQGKTALSLVDQLSRLEYDAGHYAEAKQYAEQGLAIVEHDGNGAAAQAVEPLNNLARAERALADNKAAEDHYKRAIAILDTQGDAANSGILNDNLAVLYGQTGRYDEAEPHHKRALQLLEQALGRDHEEVGRAAANFGVVLNEEGRYAEAEPMLRRGLAIAEAASPQDPVSTAIILDNLSGLLRQTGRQEEALTDSRRAIALFESALPDDHPSLATSRNNLGRLLLEMGQYADAETALQRALSVDEKLYGSDHVNVAIPAANLGEVYAALGRRDEARSLLTRALTILEAQFGPAHAKLLDTLVALGSLDLADNKPKEARASFDRAVNIELASRSRFGVKARASRDQRSTEKRAFFGLLEALWQTEDEDQGHNLGRALEVGQWATMNPAALALAALGARAGAGKPQLAALTRERQDLAADWDVTDHKLTRLLAQSEDRDTGAEQSLRDRLASIETRLDEIDRDLQASYPRFDNLARPVPLTVKDVQTLLRPGEAAVQYVVGPDATYVWTISANDQRWLRLPTGEGELLTEVRALRCGLDAAEWNGEGRDRCAELLDMPKDKAPADGEPLPFRPERANALYTTLFGQIADALQGRDLLIVASGPLTALPFQVLVTRKAEGSDTATGSDLSQVAWFARDHAVTMLPALSSLKTLRLYAEASHADKPYLGIGNPLLTGEDGTDRSAWARQACPQDGAAPARVAEITNGASLSRLISSGVGTLEALRRQEPLPETVDEICSVAKSAGAGTEALLLGANATEARIKQLSESGELANARIVHFATHGLIAGQAEFVPSARGEPSLLLTPPELRAIPMTASSPPRRSRA